MAGRSTEPFLRQGLILATSMAMMNGANWLFHVFMSRALGPTGYGGLNALLGLLVIMTVPSTTIQMGLSTLVARRMATQEGSFVASVLRRWLAPLLSSALLLFLASVVLGPWVATVLKIDSPVPVWIAGTVFVSWFALPVVRGLLQGEQHFVALGASFVTEGFLKLGVGTLLVSVGWGLSGAVAAVSLGSLGALAVTLGGRRSWFTLKGAGVDPHATIRLRPLLPYAVAVWAFTVLTQSDVVLVKVLFAPAAAGVFAAASTAAKIIIYLTAPLAMVMLPETSGRYARGEDDRPILVRTATFALVGGGLLLAAYVLIPRPIMQVLFGGAYLEGAPLLPLLGMAMLAAELALLGVYFLIGRGRLGVLRWVTVQAILFVLAFGLFADSMERAAVLVAVAALVACGGVWWPLVRQSDSTLRLQRQSS